MEREAKEKEFLDGQHENMINGVWHCSNCGIPESIAIGRRKGPLGDKSQCGTCGMCRSIFLFIHCSHMSKVNTGIVIVSLGLWSTAPIWSSIKTRCETQRPRHHLRESLDVKPTMSLLRPPPSPRLLR
jgi:hypothetical protein